MDFPDCTQETKNKEIVIRDKGAKNRKSIVYLLNPQQKIIKLIDIEDCVIKEGLRCDKLAIAPPQKLIFIELKGNDVKKAIAQLTASLNYIKNACTSARRSVIIFLVSCTQYPRKNTQLQIQKAKLKKIGITPVIKSGELKYKVS
ncbi:MAG: hypothetical protein AAGG51_05770 [Cyanobacteria bacterium P01_G01_bin.54]